MPARILVDLSHYEPIQSIPHLHEKSKDFLFFFNSVGDNLADFSQLEGYDLLILGSPAPTFREEYLFRPAELKAIKRYVAEGGSILLTSSKRGDFDMPNSAGSLRVLYKLTGIAQFANALAFHRDPSQYHEKKALLRIQEFPSHPIFADFTKDDYLVFGNSTYLTLHPDADPAVLLTTPPQTECHYYHDKAKAEVGTQALLALNTFGSGAVITAASTSFLTTDPHSGIDAGANRKFVENLLHWLVTR